MGLGLKIYKAEIGIFTSLKDFASSLLNCYEFLTKINLLLLPARKFPQEIDCGNFPAKFDVFGDENCDDIS